MATIRVKCTSCEKTFRATKLAAWDRPPVTNGGTADPYMVFDPGRHTPRHTVCRACYKANTQKRRPSGAEGRKRPVRVFAKVNAAVKVDQPPKAKGKGKGGR